MTDVTPGRLSFLLDAPTVGQDGAAARTLQIAKVANDLRDPRYGTFAITEGEVQQWAKNLAKLPGGIALIDFDHAADKPGAARRTEAAGWITAIRLDGGVPTAEVEWTPAGETAIRERRYLFFSPTYGPWTDETGTRYDDTLIGGALTNRPFLNMPVISLASAPAGDAGPWHPGAYQLAAADPAAQPSDSRRQMSTAELTKRLAAALGLAEDADETKILEAIAALKPAGEDETAKQLARALGLPEDADAPRMLEAITALQATPPTQKTLEQLAADAGKVVLDQAAADAMSATASKVVTLEKTLDTLTRERHDERFTLAWERAVDDLRVAPAQEDTFRELYDAQPDSTIKLLEGMSPIANATRAGSGSPDDTRRAPPGVDEAAWQLDQRVRRHMLEKDEKDYMKALQAVERADALSGGATA